MRPYCDLQLVMLKVGSVQSRFAIRCGELYDHSAIFVVLSVFDKVKVRIELEKDKIRDKTGEVHPLD